MPVEIRGQPVRADLYFLARYVSLDPETWKDQCLETFALFFRGDFQYTSLPVLVHGVPVVNFVTSPGACFPASMYQCCWVHEEMTPVISSYSSGGHCAGLGLNWMKIFLFFCKMVFVYPWLSWNLLCRLSCPQISRDPSLCHLSAGIKGIYQHT